MTPAVLALTDPAAVPEAASQRLLETSVALLTDGLLGGEYAAWLTTAASLAESASGLLSLAVSGEANQADIAGLQNFVRAMTAAANLFSKAATETTYQDQANAVLWATWHRVMRNDVLLTLREYAPLATSSGSQLAPIRILPAAEWTVAQANRDPIAESSLWSTFAVTDMLAIMAIGVVVV